MIEKTIETRLTELRKPVLTIKRDACLVHIYPTGQSLGGRYALRDVPLLIGRGGDCDIRIDDPSVSRHHARIAPSEGNYTVTDLESTNGTFINDLPVSTHQLEDGDYLHIGNCIYRFLSGGNIESAYHEEIYRLTIIDALTEVHNKRYLVEFLDRELARSARFCRPLSLVLFDIDHFKAVNDDLGHLCGDFTLRELATCVKAVIRKDELLARYGGEEFAVVLPESSLDDAVRVSERIRTLVEKHLFQFEDKQYLVTISLGATCTLGAEGLPPTELIRRADEKLYQAKREGRNRVAF
jgi:diguanylate cyclase (GGDEF)-like protein